MNNEMKKSRKQRETKVHEVKNVEIEKKLSYPEELLKEREAVMKILGIEQDFMVDEMNKKTK
jgi:hypothetical protein